jgi:uncharacterized membrane protein
MFHSINIWIHVVAGTIALIIGFFAIFSTRRSSNHRQAGRIFLYLLLIVVTTGFIGWLFYRSNSFLLMLTMLSGYVGYAGYRAVRLREKRTSLVDVVVASTALITGILYIIWLNKSNTSWTPSVVYATLSALILVTVYDLLKHFWLHDKIKTWWLYEHIYKMISAHSALFSAFCGTVLPQFKPFSQIGPSILSLWLIAIFIGQQAYLRNKVKKIETLP